MYNCDYIILKPKIKYYNNNNTMYFPITFSLVLMCNNNKSKFRNSHVFRVGVFTFNVLLFMKVIVN